MKDRFFLIITALFLFNARLPLEAQSSANLTEQSAAQLEKRRDIIRYGTDNEITTLIGTLKTEKSSEFDKELIEIAGTTKNSTILAALFSFFSEGEKNGLEKNALSILENRDEQRADIVRAAVDYLGKTKDKGTAEKAVVELRAVLDGEPVQWTGAAIKAYGRIAQSAGADEAADYLIEYYRDKSPTGETPREIIEALGETGSKKSTDFLIEIINNEEERYVLRMAALDAAAKIGDGAFKDAVVKSVLANDPNVRSSAVKALGAFGGADVEAAILEALRDSFFRTRLGACEAAGQRKLAEAVPYLRYRALNDEASVVRDAALNALGAIGSGAAEAALEEIFKEEKNSDRARSLAAELLIKQNSAKYKTMVSAALDDAKKKNRAALKTGLEKALAAER